MFTANHLESIKGKIIANRYCLPQERVPLPKVKYKL